MIRVLIADDEPPARRRLRSLLKAHGDVEIVAECANGDEALRDADALLPDVLFLDIQMPGVSGLALLDVLGPRTTPVIVFVTAYDDHAVRAFEKEALDYVMKPLGEERFDRTLVRVRQKLAERAAADAASRTALSGAPAPTATSRSEQRPALARIPLRSAGKITFVDVADIEWVEADGDYLRLHTGGKSHLYRSTLAALEARLDPTEFVRVHRSALVRQAAIVSLEPYFHGEYIIRTRSGARLRLSRGYKDRLPTLLG